MQDPNQPQYTPPAPLQPPVDAPQKSKKQLKWALVCLLGPTLLLILTIALYALVNFITSLTSVPPDDLFGNQNTGRVIMNVIFFIIGAFSIITWLPGLIAGIILLVTRK